MPAEVDFNEAYSTDDRVGRWCRPNNNRELSSFENIYAEQSKKWRSFLIDFAKKVGKEDAEVM